MNYKEILEACKKNNIPVYVPQLLTGGKSILGYIHMRTKYDCEFMTFFYKSLIGNVERYYDCDNEVNKTSLSSVSRRYRDVIACYDLYGMFNMVFGNNSGSINESSNGCDIEQCVVEESKNDQPSFISIDVYKKNNTEVWLDTCVATEVLYIGDITHRDINRIKLKHSSKRLVIKKMTLNNDRLIDELMASNFNVDITVEFPD